MSTETWDQFLSAISTRDQFDIPFSILCCIQEQGVSQIKMSLIDLKLQPYIFKVVKVVRRGDGCFNNLATTSLITKMLRSLKMYSNKEKQI